MSMNVGRLISVGNYGQYMKFQVSGQRYFDSATFRGGTSAIDQAFAIDIGEDGSVIMGGSTEGDWSGLNLGNNDFAVAKLDEDGVQQWTWQEGTAKLDLVSSLNVGSDGSVFLVGGTNGTWGNTTAGEEDFAIAKIDSDGNTLWRWQAGTSAFDWLHSSALLSDGSIIAVGFSYGNWNGETAGVQDFVAVVLAPDATELWRWMDGTGGTDRAHGVAVAEDGSIVIVGQTFGSWADSYAGEGDAAVAKLSSDGTIVWKWQDGTNMEDYMSEVLLATDGSIYVTGYTYGDWAGENAGDADFATIKLDAEGNELWRWQDGTALEEKIFAGAIAEDCVFLGGYTFGDWSAENAGLSDFVLLKLDANGNILWTWQEGNMYQNWITELASRDGKIAVALNVDGDWEEESAGFTDFGVIMLESNSAIVNPTPSPAVEDTAIPSAVIIPGPTPSSPTVEDTEIPTAVITPGPFLAPGPTPYPTVEDAEIPLAATTTAPFTPGPTPLPVPTLTRTPSSNGDHTAIIAGVAGVGAGVVVCATFVFLWVRRSNRSKAQGPVQNRAKHPVQRPVPEAAPEAVPEAAPDYHTLFHS